MIILRKKAQLSPLFFISLLWKPMVKKSEMGGNCNMIRFHLAISYKNEVWDDQSQNLILSLNMSSCFPFQQCSICKACAFVGWPGRLESGGWDPLKNTVVVMLPLAPSLYHVVWKFNSTSSKEQTLNKCNTIRSFSRRWRKKKHRPFWWPLAAHSIFSIQFWFMPSIKMRHTVPAKSSKLLKPQTVFAVTNRDACSWDFVHGNGSVLLISTLTSTTVCNLL